MRPSRVIVAALAAALLVAPAASAQAPERIPRSIGMQGFGEFRTSTRMIPATVPAARFRELVRVSAARWGIKARGKTARIAGYRDGADAVGFATNLPAGVLAVQQDFIVRVYRRASRRSRKARRNVYIGERIVERDISVDPRLPWQPGPAKPGLDQYDLETVLVHELGHMAGNKDHVAPCTNSPLWEALDYGEWWRSPSDWYGNTCGMPAPPPAPPEDEADTGTPPAMRTATASRRRTSARRGTRLFGHRRTVVGRIVVR